MEHFPEALRHSERGSDKQESREVLDFFFFFLQLMVIRIDHLISTLRMSSSGCRCYCCYCCHGVGWGRIKLEETK